MRQVLAGRTLATGARLVQVLTRLSQVVGLSLPSLICTQYITATADTDTTVAAKPRPGLRPGDAVRSARAPCGQDSGSQPCQSDVAFKGVIPALKGRGERGKSAPTCASDAPTYFLKIFGKSLNISYEIKVHNLGPCASKCPRESGDSIKGIPIR